MPSSKNYVRDYKQEYENDSQERRKQRAMRNAARRAYEREAGRELSSSTHVDHIKPLSKGGTNARSNLRARSASKNTSYPRTKTGKMK